MNLSPTCLFNQLTFRKESQRILITEILIFFSLLTLFRLGFFRVPGPWGGGGGGGGGLGGWVEHYNLINFNELHAIMTS